MPRRSVLTPAERASLLAFPATEEELIRHYTFSEPDLSTICQRRGDRNRLGFAIQLCYLRYPGFVLPPEMDPPVSLLNVVGRQLCIDPDVWPNYAQRSQTRREHAVELPAWLSMKTFTIPHYRHFVHRLSELAQQSDRGIVLAAALVEMLRQQLIILPAIDVIERLCGEALTLGTRRVYKALNEQLTDNHRSALDGLLIIREGANGSGLIWLRQPPGHPRPRYILAHLERLKLINELELPDGLERIIHQNRLLNLAREGGHLTAQHLRDLEPSRRYATLVAVILDTRASGQVGQPLHI
jgi:hypothetical protein